MCRDGLYSKETNIKSKCPSLLSLIIQPPSGKLNFFPVFFSQSPCFLFCFVFFYLDLNNLQSTIIDSPFTFDKAGSQAGCWFWKAEISLKVSLMKNLWSWSDLIEIILVTVIKEIKTINVLSVTERKKKEK